MNSSRARPDTAEYEWWIAEGGRGARVLCESLLFPHKELHFQIQQTHTRGFLILSQAEGHRK